MRGLKSPIATDEDVKSMDERLGKPSRYFKGPPSILQIGPR